MPIDASYTITDLAKLTGLNVRTIRYWISQGLVPASGESGPGAHYGQGHLDRLQLIKRLQGEYLPNAEIRRRITPLSDAEVAEVLDEPTATPHRPTTSALDYVRGLLGSAGKAEPDAAPAQSTPPPLAARARRAPDAPSASSVGRIIQLREAPASELAMPKETEPTTPERSQWERLSLGPDIELHIRRPLSRIEQRRVERLITIARQVLGEDQS